MRVPSHIRRFATLTLLGGALLLVRPTPAGSAGELLPDLQPLAASELRLETTTAGNTLLRFTTTSANRGDGPLELFVKATDSITGGRQNVYQRIYLSGGGSTERLAGAFVYHPEHAHFHFEQYANYTLIPEAGPGRTGEKTTFCVMDTNRIDIRLPGAPKQAVYRTCGADVQGMSVGWGDSYRYYLAGQSVDVTDAPAGRYRLNIDIDPANRLTEKSDANNQSSVLIDLDVAAGRLSIVGAKGNGR